MLFASTDYVVFLTLVFALFWLLADAGRLRVLMLLLASWLFYMGWNASFVLLIIASTVIDYWCGGAIAAAKTQRGRKTWLIVSLVTNLGLLGVFKYLDFFITNVAAALSLVGLNVPVEPLGIILPVGVSFYTFQSLSYTLDIYRGTLQPIRSFPRFALFVAFFPQLVAGPIVRASEFLPQLDNRPSLTVQRASSALWLMLKGLIKKVCIADFLAVNLIDRIFEAPGRFGAAEVLLAVYAYTWQIYGDFSGYTDIARGSAKLLGFELPENFNRPFIAHNLVEFWRRWHMTLTRWITDYLYVSLGGSRLGGVRTYVNIAITWLAIGLWHGASWNFVFFGAWHALGIMLYRLWRSHHPDAGPATGWKFILGVVGTFHFHVFNWPLFRASTFQGALDIYREILFGDWGIWRIDPIVTWVVIGCFVVHFTPIRWLEEVRVRFVAAPVLVQATVASVAGVVIAKVAASQPVPFIYFQF